MLEDNGYQESLKWARKCALEVLDFTSQRLKWKWQQLIEDLVRWHRNTRKKKLLSIPWITSYTSITCQISDPGCTGAYHWARFTIIKEVKKLWDCLCGFLFVCCCVLNLVLFVFCCQNLCTGSVASTTKLFYGWIEECGGKMLWRLLVYRAYNRI